MRMDDAQRQIIAWFALTGMNMNISLLFVGVFV